MQFDHAVGVPPTSVAIAARVRPLGWWAFVVGGLVVVAATILIVGCAHAPPAPRKSRRTPVTMSDEVGRGACSIAPSHGPTAIALERRAKKRVIETSQQRCVVDRLAAWRYPERQIRRCLEHQTQPRELLEFWRVRPALPSGDAVRANAEQLS